jgi:UDP-glucose 4-epimerase
MTIRLSSTKEEIMKALVTGGSGFIGSHLVTHLLEEGHDVMILDAKAPFKDEHRKYWRLSLVDDYTSNAGFIFKEFKPDIVYHLAAQTSVERSVKDPMHDAHVNIMGTLNVIRWCEKYKAKLVFASTAATYGEPRYLPIDEDHELDPASPYGVSKMACESYIRQSGVNHTILRFGNVYGHGGVGVITHFILDAVNHGQVWINGDGNQKRDFIYVKDLVRALIDCMDKGDGKTINLSSNTQTTIQALRGIISEVLQTEIAVSYHEKREGDIEDSQMTNSLALTELNWSPLYGLKDGIADMVDDMNIPIS